MENKIEFIDANNRRVRLTTEITECNGYPEFSISGQYGGSHGQVSDHIKPAHEAQKELLRLWDKYHLKNISSMHNFKEHLEGVLKRIEVTEAAREDKKLEGDDVVIELMEQEGIDEYLLEAVKAYIFLMGDNDLSDFKEAYSGEFRDDEDFAQDMADNIGALNEGMNWPYTCIDWEQAARELMQDYNEENGFYFRSI